MNIDEREWDILRAIRSGTKPEDIVPPLQGAYEWRFYEEHKAEYDKFKKQGIDIVWAPVSD